MTDSTPSTTPSTPLAVNHTPHTQIWMKNAWANASRDAVRYKELYDFYLQLYASEQKKDISEMGEETRDRAQVHAWLTIFAETGRLFVVRNSRRGSWYHRVSILDDDGNVVASTGGFVTDVDVLLGKWDQIYVRWTEKVNDDYSRINLMTSTILPDIPAFQRADGKRVDLGWNDDYFECFDVVLHNDAIEDHFDD